MIEMSMKLFLGRLSNLFMYLSILTLPLLGGLLANRKCGIGGPIISTICISLATLISLVAFFEVLSGSPVIIN